MTGYFERIYRDMTSTYDLKEFTIFRSEVMYANTNNAKSCQIYYTEIATLVLSLSVLLYM